MADTDPNFFRVQIEIRAGSRERAAELLREMADQVLHDRGFRQSSAPEATWEVTPKGHPTIKEFCDKCRP